MKTIEVVAAVIRKGSTCLATQRGYGEFEGLWEFPGGKIEPGETHQVALKREIQEELGIDITIGELLCTTEYDYPSFHLRMHCYLCSLATDNIELREHKSARWLTAETLDTIKWLPADKEVIDKLKDVVLPDEPKQLTHPGSEMNFRKMRRIRQQLSQDECESILTSAYRGFLSVNGDMGYPYTIPMNFVYDNGHIYFHSALKGHRIDAVKSSPNACFTVIDEPVKEENDWWFHVKSVICFGKVSIIEQEEERTTRLRLLGKKYFPEEHDLNGELVNNGPHVAVLDFKIEHITGKRVKEN